MQFRKLLRRLLLIALCLGSVGVARGEEPERIRDNLFLLEEAYNQEPGVIQHIQTLMFNPKARSWSYSFTEEWPVPNDLHQLSLTIPVMKQGRGESVAVGDLLVNYRLQILGRGGKEPLFISPRLSLVLPTGDYQTGIGRGVFGVQTNLPVSWELDRDWVLHLNAGATIAPGARSSGGASGLAVDGNAGVALVWQPVTWLNPLVEVGYLSTGSILDDGARVQSRAFFVNPGVRTAIDFESGLQIVPGISVPIQRTEGRTDISVFGYLSFEHPAFTP